jgi:hypothetical protein
MIFTYITSPPSGEQPTTPTADELALALERAIRRGSIDVARRLADRLAGPDRTLRTYEIATSHRSGGA